MERKPLVLLPTGLSELPFEDTLRSDNFGIVIQGGLLDIELGYKAMSRAKTDGNISSYRIDSYEAVTNNAVAGSISINVKKNGATIGVVALLAASTVLDTTLSGWTTDFAKGDLFQYEVTTNSGIKNLTLTLFF
jgi:predicted nucleic acid-binding protein